MTYKMVHTNGILFLAVVFVIAVSPTEGRPTDNESQQQDTVKVNGIVYVRKPGQDEKEIQNDFDSLKREENLQEKTEKKEIKTQLKEDLNDLAELESAEETVKNPTKEEGGDKKEEHVVEGDIILTPQITELMSGNQNVKRVIYGADKFKWPNQKYFYHLSSDLSAELVKRVKEAINIVARQTCIKFINKKDKDGYVLFQTSRTGGCNSMVGKQAREFQPQPINVAAWCEVGNLQHEILHSLGFLHEQSRPDRDSYVTIHYENIKPGTESNFEKYPHPIVALYKEPYDYGSIMHYTRKAFSKNSKDTIVPKDSSATIGQRDGLSKFDLKLLNKHYKCRRCENTGWFCFIRKFFSSCNRATSKCLRSCGFWCKA